MGRPALNVNTLDTYYELLRIMCTTETSYVAEIAKRQEKTPETILRQLQILEKEGYVSTERQKLLNIKKYKPEYNNILKGLIREDLNSVKTRLKEFPFGRDKKSQQLKKHVTSEKDFLTANIDKLSNTKFAENIVDGLFEMPYPNLWHAYVDFIKTLKFAGGQAIFRDASWQKYALLLSKDYKLNQWFDYLEYVGFIDRV